MPRRLTKTERERRDAEWHANEARIAKQRALWGEIPDSDATRELKRNMLDRAWELVNSFRYEEADALLEFLPLADVVALLDEAFPAEDEPKPPTPTQNNGEPNV